MESQLNIPVSFVFSAAPSLLLLFFLCVTSADNLSHFLTLSRYLPAVLDTLDRVHSCGVIVTDVKPQHIICQPNGMVGILDFDLAYCEVGFVPGVSCSC